MGDAARGSSLDSLDSSAKAAVLDSLLRAHPELREAAEEIARGVLVDIDPDAIADVVDWDLRAPSIDELNERAGSQPLGYVHPTDAAWELLAEALEPHIRELTRLLDLGLIEAAVANAVGLIAGLYRCREGEDGDLILSWAPDFPAEQARTLMEKLINAGCELPERALAGAAPDWAAQLLRSGPAGM